MSVENISQSAALTLTENEANHLLRRLAKSAFLKDRSIEVYTVPSLEKIPMADGTSVPAMTVMVRAETDKACGIGVGFVTAISEGLI